MNKKLLKKKIQETQNLIAKRKLRESAPRSLGIALLVESDMQKAELLLATKAITAELQNIAEKIAKIEADDVMPIIDNMKASFGPEAAERFYRASTDSLRKLVDTLQATKSTISDHIMQLENGGPINDMAMSGDDMAPEDDFADDTDMDADADADVALAGHDDADAPDDDMASADEFAQDEFGDAESSSFAGRDRKESFISDRTVLECFRRTMSEGTKASKAAKMVAEELCIDVSDVRAIIKEAAKA